MSATIQKLFDIIYKMIKHLKNRIFLPELLFFALLTAVLHYISLVNHLYFTVYWFDIPMHFLGGLTMGFLALFIFFTSGYVPPLSRIKDNRCAVFVVVVSFTLVIGLGWELWEIFVGFSDVMKDQGDTMLDLVMDFFGALAAFYYSKTKIK
jgi:hypothetical protein